ncbi:hypothetical protein BO71DRAFT_485678 [Aspergillus ellipticus CBS 707.79]|uniref:Thioesterase/thiol ester dehydrase-isomerase n=1 Tax=Aspergillus ellipticus CBS 707.79 TaxID=1448320 RepID=A0A319D4S8_9EURO|nr:hypothetical protein BO71DRAFT_485678 [Aspergillus ellipticus CBS 707.79]
MCKGHGEWVGLGLLGWAEDRLRIRLFHPILTTNPTKPPPQPPAPNSPPIFHPTITKTLSPLSECDYNLHKSNSTYFTDIDVSRATLCARLFGSRIAVLPSSSPTAIRIVLGGVQCVFRHEIRPYQGYEVWSRVVSWDEKWFYVGSWFVEGIGIGGRREGEGNGEGKDETVFAACVSRYVFKRGRVTYPPGRMLGECGLLGGLGEEIEERRKRDLEKARLTRGWDVVYEAFEGGGRVALGS